MKWTYVDRRTVQLADDATTTVNRPRRADGDPVNVTPSKFPWAKQQPEMVTFGQRFKFVVGELLEESLENLSTRSGVIVNIPKLDGMSESDIEAMVTPIISLLTHSQVEEVVVPGAFYSAILGKCKVALIKEAAISMGLSKTVFVGGCPSEAKNLVDVSLFTRKLRCEGMNSKLHSLVENLNNLDTLDMIGTEICPALSAAIAHAYRRMKKGQRTKHKEKIKQDKFEKMTGTTQSRNNNQERNTSYDKGPLRKPFETDYPKCYICKQRYNKTKQDTVEEASNSSHHYMHVYDRLCPQCANLNNKKREQSVDLSEHYVVLTGGRLKIGFELAVKMLRDGARVIVTTRFPNDAAKRFADAEGFDEWTSRLLIYQLDLRDARGIYDFVEYVQHTFPHLDALVNNAAQTIHRPVQFYRHLLAYESAPRAQLPTSHTPLLAQANNAFLSEDTCRSICDSTDGETAEMYGKRKLLSQNGPSTKARKDSEGHQANARPAECDSDDKSSSEVARPVTEVEDISKLMEAGTSGSDISSPNVPVSTHIPVLARSLSSYFPDGELDTDGQQVDLRPTNSWRAVLDNVPVPELLEVLMVNTVGPFILNQQLKPMLSKSPNNRKFIVNVSAMEGNFSRKAKTKYHPHTNMAKAAMNMMTRTAALGFAEDRIYMTCVDTGWVTDERPFHQAQHEQDTKGFKVPLDLVDGAARVYDPIVRGLDPKNEPLYAVFLKDYKVYPW